MLTKLPCPEPGANGEYMNLCCAQLSVPFHLAVTTGACSSTHIRYEEQVEPIAARQRGVSKPTVYMLQNALSIVINKLLRHSCI